VATATRSNGSRRSSEQLTINSALNAVTELETAGGNRRATIIHLDGLPWRATATTIVKDLGIAVGQRYPSALLDKRIREKEKRLAMDLALQMLSYRVRSRREITDRLAKRKLAPEAVEAALTRLEQAGYLNETAFVRSWIKERVELRGYGRQRIKNELLSKGIAADAIDQELGAFTEEQERAMALTVAKNRLSRYNGLDEVVKRRRLMQILMRRGFGAQIAQSVLKEALSEAI